jgi:hypothetical protein
MLAVIIYEQVNYNDIHRFYITASSKVLTILKIFKTKARMKYLMLVILSIFFYGSNQDVWYKKRLIDDIYLIIPNTKFLSKDSTYIHIKILKGKKLIFEDKSLTEYIIDDEFWPFSRKLNNETIEILIKVFDAPDYDKIHGLYICGDKLMVTKVYPDFSTDLKKSFTTLNSILGGYMNISESPCENCDSCYYNPKLFFRFGANGVYLDSLLTKQENEKQWGKFYGFHLTEKVILPCVKKTR